MGDREEPIDWDGSKAKIIGSMNFTLSIEKRLKISPTRFVDKKVILSAISDELCVPTECFLNPKGREERKIRHKAIEIMFKKYNLKFTEIAKLLNISRFAVMKVVK